MRRQGARNVRIKRWGMAPQKPEVVQAWLDGQYPAIEARAKPRVQRFTGVMRRLNTDVRGRCCAPSGQTPAAYAVGATRQKLSMISTVTTQGKVGWMIIGENFGADKLIEFLAALIKDAKKKVLLILDNLRVHHGKRAKAWLEEHKAKIEVFYLPGYSPPLNQDERLNGDLKYALGSTVALRTKSTLWDATAEYMTMLGKSPERVQSYCQDPRVQYAAQRLYRSVSIRTSSHQNCAFTGAQ